MAETESPPFGPLTRGRDETGRPARIWTGLEPLTHGKGLPCSASSGLYGIGVPHTRQGHARRKIRRRPLVHSSPHARGTPDALEQSCLICPDCFHAKGAPAPVGGKPNAFPTACHGHIRPSQYTETRPPYGFKARKPERKKGESPAKGLDLQLSHGYTQQTECSFHLVPNGVFFNAVERCQNSHRVSDSRRRQHHLRVSRRVRTGHL